MLIREVSKLSRPICAPHTRSLLPTRLFTSSASSSNTQSTHSQAHSEGGSGLHFENHRVEDAMPFNYDNKFTFALKLGLFSAVGFAIPVIGVWWNM